MNRGEYLLAGDVGGTKTILAMHELSQDTPTSVANKSYLNSAYASFDDLVRAFLAESAVVPQRVCLAVAGPVSDGRVLMTNLMWTIEASELGRLCGCADVSLLNDVEALAWALPALDGAQILKLNEGQRERCGNIALLAAGTGCGEAQLIWDGDQYLAVASEGGHCDFAPADATQVRLLQFLRREFSHVSVERVCSGMGLQNIYRFLRDEERLPEDPWLSERMRETRDPARVIGEAGVEGESALCVETLKLFASILAAEAGNLGLRCLASGGVYIGGGIPSRLLPFLQTEEFRAAFTAKGRFQSMLEQIPLCAILDNAAALAGAVRWGLSRATRDKPGAARR